MEKVRKVSTIVLYALMVVSVALFVYMVASIDDEKNPSDSAVLAITRNLNWSIVLFVFAAAAVLIFAIGQIVTDKAKLIRALISVGILGVVLVIAYSLASNAIPKFYGVEKFVADGTLTESVSKWVGTGLYSTYILFAGAFAGIIGFGLVSIFKR